MVFDLCHGRDSENPDRVLTFVHAELRSDTDFYMQKTRCTRQQSAFVGPRVYTNQYIRNE
jgi:hypothetical protein